ncbi:MAG TPA: glyoxalase [Chloroflexi bacterium]|nr:glyoxalase [Chloroflexota bacterium]HHW85930.1 glyoxalase [Chloroflexota bacterium]
MHLEHAAIWTPDLERLKTFYVKHFGATPSARYVNEKRGFASYFLSFDSGTRLEIMTIVGLSAASAAAAPVAGYAHLAFALGSTARVDGMTAELAAAGCTVLSAPRWTGDGYYESVVLDPDGNQIELTV